MELFASTILRHPVWYSTTEFDEVKLPLSLGDYKVTPGESKDARWTVTSSKGEVVYNGLGPVSLVTAQ